MIASKFSGRWDDTLEKDSDGKLFIDQPIELFQILINYLRDKQNCTPSMPAVESPFGFDHDYEKRRSFFRMVEYYGLTHGIYPVEATVIGGDKASVSVKTKGADFTVEANDWACVKISHSGDRHLRSIESFEVVLGHFSSANVEWIAADIAEGLPEKSRGTVTELPGVTIEKGSTIRCEKGGEKWYVDGRCVAKTKESASSSETSEAAKIMTAPTPQEGHHGKQLHPFL